MLILPNHKDPIALPDFDAPKIKLTHMRQLQIMGAIKRLEVGKLREILRDAQVNVVDKTDDMILAVGHKMRLGLVLATPQEKAASEEYLRFRNMM